MSSYAFDGDGSISEIPGARLIFKRGEASQLVRPFQGDTAKLNDYLNTLQLGVSTDYEIPDMVLDQIEAMENGPLADVKQIYYGDPNGIFDPFNPTQVLTDVGWETRSTLLGTMEAIDGFFYVNYYSPTLTFKYCTSGIFNTPNYGASQLSTNPDGSTSTPQAITILDFAPAPGNANPSGYAITGKWNYKIYPICTSFKRTQRGSVYNYLETWSIVLLNPNGVSNLTSGTPIPPPVQS